MYSYYPQSLQARAAGRDDHAPSWVAQLNERVGARCWTSALSTGDEFRDHGTHQSATQMSPHQDNNR
jgi:hypothetical protein